MYDKYVSLDSNELPAKTFACYLIVGASIDTRNSEEDIKLKRG